MNSIHDDTQINLAASSLWGTAQGIFVHTLIYPLEVVKIRLQCSQSSESSLRVALALFQKEGLWAFYRGLAPQLLKTSLKQIWCWPMIMGAPPFFQRWGGMGEIQRQVLTGFCIATIEAAVTSPLERLKILSAVMGKMRYSLREACRNGWQGSFIHWTKLSVTWTTFLTTQKSFRDQSRPQSGSLSLSQLIRIGVQVALIVSLVSAPFDIANTLKQVRNLDLLPLFYRGRFLSLYRGWSLSMLSLAINNVASIILMEKLKG